jgi:hypothetical protein
MKGIAGPDIPIPGMGGPDMCGPGIPGAAGTPGGDSRPPGGIIIDGGAAPGGTGKFVGIPPEPFICTMLIGTLWAIMAWAAMAPGGGAALYGAAIGTFCP